MNLFYKFFNGKQANTSALYSYSKLVFIDDEKRKTIQLMLLEMLKDIIIVCEKYHLRFCLIGGSALGSVRHNGFIPWDDDLDIAMTRHDYNKFLKIFPKELNRKYILNAPNLSDKAIARFPKIIKRDTIMRQLGGTLQTELQGIFVDIFIIDNVPNNKAYRMCKGTLCDLLSFISSQVFNHENEDSIMHEYNKSLKNEIGFTNYYIRKLTGTIFSFIPSYKWFNMIDKCIQCKSDESDLCTLATGRKHYFGEMLPQKCLLPYSKGIFSDLQVYLPHSCKKYLTNLYGDYMLIPSPDKREKHYVIEFKV